MASSSSDRSRERRESRESEEDMIDGLKLTVTGEEMRRLLEQRMNDHQRRADRWKREEARTPEEQTEDEPLLPSARRCRERLAPTVERVLEERIQMHRNIEAYVSGHAGDASWREGD